MVNRASGRIEGREASDVVSIIGPGMTVTGDCDTDGTLRVEGTVEGGVRAAKAVVVGKGGTIRGDIDTQDAVVAGRVSGSITAASRVELQAGCRVEGDIHSRRVKLEEGGVVDGRLEMGDRAGRMATSPQSGASVARAGGEAG
ncbi:MAG: polymer-forming cytoskeletal protein [Candidatus Palauibacterales bacterium]|nr:polymer-forming cytoskeletal protein [Candidatus Palauibacterales bacterium]MDP2530999.1 polymer-forming cytoskeletal protein [Candidatus Palauibacterales bacterium]MDP2583442.1 polymer-forming cytoskeletal protein [Candidatus Palauibacterales bacterium]